MSGAIMAVNQWQWFTWFSRRHHFLPPPLHPALLFSQLSSLTAADELTTSPPSITWTRRAFDVLFTMMQPCECRSWCVCYVFGGGLLVIDCAHQKWETTPFSPLKPPPPNKHTLTQRHQHSSTKQQWQLNAKQSSSVLNNWGPQARPGSD